MNAVVLPVAVAVLNFIQFNTRNRNRNALFTYGRQTRKMLRVEANQVT